jgi:ADP-ribosylglycohydrolase
MSDPNGFSRRHLLETLHGLSMTFVVQRKLEILLEQPEEGVSDDEVIYTVGNGIRTSEAVAASLWAFLRYGDDPEECTIQAVNFGGDTDTIGAMVGAQLGSLYGSEWIPGRWYTQIENRRHGRDFMIDLAKKLARLDVGASGPSGTP